MRARGMRARATRAFATRACRTPPPRRFDAEAGSRALDRPLGRRLGPPLPLDLRGQPRSRPAGPRHGRERRRRLGLGVRTRPPRPRLRCLHPRPSVRVLGGHPDGLGVRRRRDPHDGDGLGPLGRARRPQPGLARDRVGARLLPEPPRAGLGRDLPRGREPRGRAGRDDLRHRHLPRRDLADAPRLEFSSPP